MYENTKFKGLDSREIISLPNSKEVMKIARHFDHRKNKPHAHHNTHLHTMKVYNTRAVSLTFEVLLLKILFFLPLNLIIIQAIEFVDLPLPEKLDIFRNNLPKISS